MAWADCRFRPGCDGDTVVLTTSTDGSTWTPRTRVPGTGFDSFVPGIAVDPNVPGRDQVCAGDATDRAGADDGESHPRHLRRGRRLTVDHPVIVARGMARPRPGAGAQQVRRKVYNGTGT